MPNTPSTPSTPSPSEPLAPLVTPVAAPVDEPVSEGNEAVSHCINNLLTELTDTLSKKNNLDARITNLLAQIEHEQGEHGEPNSCDIPEQVPSLPPSHVLTIPRHMHEDIDPIDLATLANFASFEGKNFKEVFLPEIDIDYCAFKKIFFKSHSNKFTGHHLDDIWKGITNFSLASHALEHYMESTDTLRKDIEAYKIIAVSKETNFQKLTDVAKHVQALTGDEFKNALKAAHFREDHKIVVYITIYLWFPSLNVGCKIVIRLAIKHVPSNLVGYEESNPPQVGYAFPPASDTAPQDTYEIQTPGWSGVDIGAG
jgi:hypothetical protein